MDKKKLFVIPVYSMSHQVFDVKKIKFLKNNKWKENDNSFTNNAIKNIFFNEGKLTWHYNQAIAFIEIYKVENKIEFKIYKTIEEEFGFETNHRYIHYKTIANSFDVTEEMSDSDIKEGIDNWINEFTDKLFPNKYSYIDRETFDNQLKLINLKNIFIDEEVI